MLLTNASALTALKTLRTANASLQQTQDRISTGLKVAKADDNAAFFLVANTQRSDITVLEGTNDNLDYALGALRAAQATQGEFIDIIDNIAAAIVSLETGTAEKELSLVIEEQVERAWNTISSTSFNGINLLERRNVETFQTGIERTALGGLKINTLSITGAGLGIRPPAVSGLAAPLPGAVMDFNSTTMTGSPGNLNPTTPGNIAGVNIGTNGSGGTDQRTFAISFETGSDITTQQVIYEEGGNVRGINISIRNGNLVFGGYNLPAGDPTAPWPYQEVTATVQPNTRYTAQLVLDGQPDNTGVFRAYLDGTLVDTATGVGILYDHPGGIGIGRINGNAVVNGTVTNRITGPSGNDFQGLIDKVVQYNDVFNGDDFDVITTYLAEGWLPPKGVAYYVGSPLRLAEATLIELLEATIPEGQDGYSTDAALEVLEAARQKVNTAMAELGFLEARVVSQQDYLDNLTDAMGEGVAALVEADLQEESARLQAFQVQTQLAQQGLLIANRRPQTILQLFN